MSKSTTVLVVAAVMVLIVFGVVRAQEQAYALDRPTLTATEVDGEIVLSWTEVEGATRYDLQLWDCVNEWRPISENDLRTTQAVHTDPADEITYLYTVQALNDQGEKSDWAAISKYENGAYDFVRETVNPIPSPDFEVVAQADHIQLHYSNVEEAVGYQARVWYPGAGDDWLWLPEENLDLDSRTFSYTDVQPGVTYFFVMRSYSENKCGYSDWSGYKRHTFTAVDGTTGGTTDGTTDGTTGGAGGTTGTANTPTPTSTTAPTATSTRQPLPGQISWNTSSSTHNSVTLSWQAPEPPALQYRLRLSGSDRALYEGPATQYTHTGLAANTAYRYEVRGRTGDGDWGPWSYVETVWTAVDPAELSAYVPGAPATLDARNEPAFGIRLRWRNNARAQPGDCACPVTGHQILRRLSGPGQQFQVIATIGSTTSYHDSSASPGVQYTYQVRARNRHGLSGPSGSASATHLLPTATPTSQPLPGQISWNTSSSTHNSVTLSWQALDPPAAQYRLRLSASDDALYEGPATQFTHTGLAANTAYSYAVRGRIGDGDWGPWSYETVWTTVDPAELSAYVPGAPATLDARNEPAFGIRLRWRNNARAQPGDCACPVTGHQILRRLSGPGQPFQVIAAIGSTTSYHDSSASPGVQYTYQVRARNRHGLSGPSGSASATYLPPAP